MENKVIAVIPAHLASVRFPRKILFNIHDLPMIEHVRRRALLCQEIEEVYVATCDDEINSAISDYGGKVIRTSNQHKNGTSRVAEAVKGLDCTHVLLLQGDEPLLLPRHLSDILQTIQAEPHGHAWNATGPIKHENELDLHSFVKCSVSPDQKILYCFRRSPCYSEPKTQMQFIRKILGIIAYRKDFLMRLTEEPATPIEQAEFIEQMRIIESGHSLRSVPVSHSLPSINEPHEANIVLDYIENHEEQSQLLQQILNQ